MESDSRYTIGELADLAGVSRRTIRYYVQRDLLPPPLGAGRGHYYTGEHLQRLLSVRLLQDRGLPLDAIERQLSAPPREAREIRPARATGPSPDLSLWTRLHIADGAELHVEGGRYRLSPARLLRLREAVRAIIGEPFPAADDETDDTKGEDDHA